MRACASHVNDVSSETAPLESDPRPTIVAVSRHYLLYLVIAKLRCKRRLTSGSCKFSRLFIRRSVAQASDNCIFFYQDMELHLVVIKENLCRHASLNYLHILFFMSCMSSFHLPLINRYGTTQNKRTGAANFVVWNYERHKCRYHSIPEGHIPVDTLTAPAGGVGRSIIRLSLAPATRTTGITRDNKWLSKYFQTYGSPNPL